MRNRSVFNLSLRVASAVALLVALTTSPLRPLHSSCSSVRPEFARSDWAGIPGRSSFPTRLLPTSVTVRPVSVKALPSANEEEELDGDSQPALRQFDLCSSVSPISIAKLATDGNTHSFHPLRC
jgi:hypothetical protein